MNLQLLCFRELPPDFRLVLQVNPGELMHSCECKPSSGKTRAQDLTLGEWADSGMSTWKPK